MHTLFHQSPLSAAVAQTFGTQLDQHLSGRQVRSWRLLSLRCCPVSRACLLLKGSFLGTGRGLAEMGQTGACFAGLGTSPSLQLTLEVLAD